MTSFELRDFIKENGKENVIFNVPMLPVRSMFGVVSYTSSSDEHINVDCVIDETRYKVEEGYKITLVALDETFGSEDFYQMDLASLIKYGSVKVRTV